MRIAFARAAMTAALTTTSLVGFSGSALADDNADAAPADATATKPADVPSTGEIIVSARRRSETLSSTPVAITAITASMLENKASANIGDLTGAAPGLLITQQNTGAAAANLSIRGLTYADVENRRRQLWAWWSMA